MNILSERNRTIFHHAGLMQIGESIHVSFTYYSEYLPPPCISL